MNLKEKKRYLVEGEKIRITPLVALIFFTQNMP